MYETALSILNKLDGLGYQAYIVGGYPRNKYLGIPSTDIDICTNAPLDVIHDNFNVVKDNKKYGSHVIKENNHLYEVTSFRKDYYEGSRYPDIIFVDKIEEDLKRRDFTINTLCIDKNGNYCDYLNCILDIQNKIIKTIKDAKLSIEEDPLRILRAIRFSSDLQFAIDDDLYKVIKENNFLLETLTSNRMKLEISKVKNKKQFNKLIEELDLKKYLK